MKIELNISKPELEACRRVIADKVKGARPDDLDSFVRDGITIRLLKVADASDGGTRLHRTVNPKRGAR